jgi:signal transduction histidine kinase
MLKTSALENEKEKQVKFIYLSLIILGMLSSIFAYFFLKSKNRKEKLLQVYKTETRISKKVHDEVANDIYHVMTRLQHHDVNEDMVLDDLEHIYTKTRDISKESRPIDFREDFKEVLSDLLISYDSKDVSVVTKGLNDIDWTLITDLKKTAIYRVLQELMTNMKKHSNASITVLTFQKLNAKLQIKYSDNGIGSDLKKHNGLQNAENRIKSLKGTIIFESNINEGFKVIITV